MTTFFNWLAPSITAWFATFITRKIVTVTTTISAFIFLTVAFVACIKQIVLTVIALAAIPAWLVSGVSMFVPINFTFIVSSIWSAQSCRWAFDIAREKIAMMNNAQ